MSLIKHISAQINDLFFGPNWVASSFKENLKDINWKQATTKIDSFNTIVGLVYHTNYYIKAFLMVIRENNLKASDKYSFDHPPIQSQEDWEKLVATLWKDAEDFAQIVAQFPEEKLWDDFWENKYGDYYKNIQGIIEHSYYHLGQIVLIKKMLV